MNLRILTTNLLLLFFLLGCTAKPQLKIDYQKFNLGLDTQNEYKNDTNSTTKIGDEKNIQKEEKIQDIPKFIKAGNLPNKMGRDKITFLKNPKEKFQISVENIPISKFIHFVFGELLKINYSISEEVEKQQDKVTMRIEKKIESAKLLTVVESVLSNYNIDITTKDGVTFINKGKNNSKLKLDYKISFGTKIQYKNLPANEIIYQIIPVSYLSLGKAQELLAQFALSKDLSRVYTMNNIHSILVKDYAGNIQKGLELISNLDNPYMKNKQFKLIHFEHIKVNTFSKRMKTIFKTLNIRVASDIQGEPITFLPIEEINSLFVITEKSELIETILYWKDKLDNLEELSEEKQLFVYKTKNRDAGEIKKILTTLIENTKTKNTAKNSKLPSTKELISQQLKITADEERNTLIFYMLPNEYKNIFSLLNKIDSKAEQLLIEVTIAEVTLIDKLQFGVEWFLKNKADSSDSWNIQTLKNLGIGSGGITGSISNSVGTTAALLNAFAQNNILNILSSPKIVVLNKKTASFNVGTQVPIITSQSTASDLGSGKNGVPTVVQSVNYRSTGISTSVTPTIAANNSILLKINQTISEAQKNNTSSISSPIIVNRSLSTEVVLKNGEELILGGIIRENDDSTETKVPFLGDLPFIGNLFKTYSKTKDRTELIFIVKPYILNNQSDNSLIKAFNKLTIFKKKK